MPKGRTKEPNTRGGKTEIRTDPQIIKIVDFSDIAFKLPVINMLKEKKKVKNFT